jgi:hypothetical protein
MQALFIILGALGVLIPGLFIVSMFLPATVKVVRVRAIPASLSVVFDQVNILRNWEKWSPWLQADPKMKLSYNDKKSGTGAGYQWISRNRKVGKGSVIITASRPYEHITIEMQFMENKVTKGYFRFEPSRVGTHVTWGIAMEVGRYPAGKIRGLMLDKLIGKDFEKGLENLEKLVK